MTNYESVLIALQIVNDKIDFSLKSDSEIVNILRNSRVNKNEPLTDDELAEFYAFSLLENSTNGSKWWNTYFGPRSIQFIDGTISDEISLEKITPEVIGYWKLRLKECKNPVLVARYAGLIYDFELKVLNVRSDYHTIVVPYITNLLRSVDEDRVLSFPACREKLRRALTLSVKMKNNALIASAIGSVLRFQEKRVDPEKAGTWRISYDLLLRSDIIGPGSDEYANVILWLELWFVKACMPLDGKIDVNNIEVVFEPLLDEYIKTNSADKAMDLLEKMELCYNQRIQICSTGEGIHWLEKLKTYFQKANFKSKIEELNLRIEELGPRLIAEMKLIRVESTFTKDEIDSFIEKILALPEHDIYHTLARVFILDAGFVLSKNDERNNGIIDYVNKSIYNKQGRKVAVVEGVDDESGKLIQKTQMQITYSSIFLHFILLEGKERNILTVESFLEFVRKSIIISPDRYPIISMAFQFWLEGNFIAAIHILIPQIEAACLTIAKKASKSIHKENKYGGYNVRLFGDILRDDALELTLGTDGINYFTTLFTDPRGFNLRNEVAHGLRDSAGFDQQMANATLIALLYLVSTTTSEDDIQLDK